MISPWSVIVGVALGLFAFPIYMYFDRKMYERKRAERRQGELITSLQMDMASANAKLRRNTLLIDRLIKNHQRLEEQYNERFNSPATRQTSDDNEQACSNK